MAYQYTEEDAQTMRRIEDGAVLDDVTELARMLADSDFGPKLIARESLDPDFRHRLEHLVRYLECVLANVKSRLAKSAS